MSRISPSVQAIGMRAESLDPSFLGQRGLKAGEPLFHDTRTLYVMLNGHVLDALALSRRSKQLSCRRDAVFNCVSRGAQQPAE